MSSTSRAWVVATSMGMVEALKDQGFCRWNHTFRSLHQHAKAHLGSLSQVQRLPPSSVDRSTSLEGKEQARQQSEEALRKVMFLSCWGPN